ncbi:MAG: adenylate/guanylate cyclase domain-containing protein [Paracoccaceae bacterium]
MRLRPSKRVMLGLIAAVLAAIWASITSFPHRAGYASILDPLETVLLNARHSTFGAIEPPDDIVIVAIDDATLQAANPLGQGRGNLASIIERIATAGASVVAVDILLIDQGSPQGDRALASALGKVPSVIAVASSASPGVSSRGFPATQDELWPQAGFTDNSEVGIVNISTDHVGVPRHIPIVFTTSKGLQLSFAAQTAVLFSGKTLELSGETLKLGERIIPMDIGFQMPLRLAGPTGTVTTISALDVLQGAASNDLSGKAVIVGVTATGLGDRFPTPFDPDLPGVEVMATAIAQLIEGEVLRRDCIIRRVDFISVLLLAMVCSVLVLTRPLSIGFPLAVGALAGWMAVTWLVFPFGIWLSAALPLAGAGPPMALAALLRYAHERRRAASSAQAVTALKKFQSPVLSEGIAENPDFLLEPAKIELVICFVDLSGFTLISQDLGPNKSEACLRRFHTLLAETVHERDGIILNFMGDGALLVYGVFETSQQPADHALKAAFRIAKSTRQLGRDLGFAHPLGCRIGLHHGEVVLSRMGGDLHQQLTVTGDSVNLCSRLLEITKSEAATIAATDEFMSNLKDSVPRPIVHRSIFPVRGRDGQVSLNFWRL